MKIDDTKRDGKIARDAIINWWTLFTKPYILRHIYISQFAITIYFIGTVYED